MLNFLTRFFKAKPAPVRPLPRRRARINPVYHLDAPARDHVDGRTGVMISEVRRGNDVSGS